jgi:hypothetical protein
MPEIKNLLDKRTKGAIWLLKTRKNIIIALLIFVFGFLVFRFGKTIFYAVKYEKQIMYAAHKYENEKTRLIRSAEAEAELNFKESLTGIGRTK